jgi:hypothetical protein
MPLLETTSLPYTVMTEDEIKAKAAEATKATMARFGTPEFEAELAANIALDNQGITHAEFVEKAKTKQMGVKFVIRPSKLLCGWRQKVFSSLVCDYYFLPWIACPLWAWHESSWWLALGVFVSKGATRTAANEKQPPVGSGILLAGIAGGLWAWLGIHSYWTYFVLCAAWGMLLFAKADQFESAAALKTLIEKKDVFDQMASTGQIMIVRR